MDPSLVNTLTRFATQVPIFLVLLGGAIVAATRYRRHPQVSGLVIGACATLLITNVMSSVANMILMRLMSSSGDYRTMGFLMSAIGGAHTLVAALCYGLLIAAAFVARPEADEARDAARAA